MFNICTLHVCIIQHFTLKYSMLHEVLVLLLNKITLGLEILVQTKNYSFCQLQSTSEMYFLLDQYNGKYAFVLLGVVGVCTTAILTYSAYFKKAFSQVFETTTAPNLNFLLQKVVTLLIFLVLQSLQGLYLCQLLTSIYIKPELEKILYNIYFYIIFLQVFMKASHAK